MKNSFHLKKPPTLPERHYTPICERLECYGLDKMEVIGLGFDDTSNMSVKV